jgi:hypothetical protein
MQYLALCDALDRAIELYQEGIILPTEFATIVSQLHPKLQAVGGVRVTTESGKTYTDATGSQFWN